MEDSAPDIMNVSPLAKVSSAVVASAAVMALVYVFTNNVLALLIIGCGIVAVAILLLAYRYVLVALQRRKAAPFTRGILSNSAVSPHAISEPARRARLDDLRRSFEGGIEKFRSSGKDLYTLPWYLVVGEPAAGKTEAIRRCNVGFPPGLQDYTQGVGGTLNMNWWFTNHAILLDTAGRMMFEEISQSAASEFREFLRLLAGNRPNCPVNGMLLVIPADSLIKDSADVIERKAGKIATQLDLIQRTLGVRFPVFVVITKCDLINGFREFFDTLDNPQLQHQMLGWTNSAPLDSVFNPDQVDQHLEHVRRSLVRRRYTLLLDPVHTEDPSSRRIDQVDALFTFPDSFMKIAPRLRRYMEMIFVAGEWSPKPLFLRGIYFTSSMREGAALDAELAEILKVPVESLPEGRVWERERAYFLRDLFTKKVFKEKGLVTRANNSDRLRRRRKLMVLGAGFASVLILFGLTWFGSVQFHRSIKQHVDFWTSIAQNYSNLKLIEDAPGGAKYNGPMPLDASETRSVSALLMNVPPRVSQPVQTPAIFQLWGQVFDRKKLDDMRRDAYGIVYETSALRPLIKAARAKMTATGDDATTWDAPATDALIDLMNLQVDAQVDPNSESAGHPTFSIDPLAAYVLPDRVYAERYLKDRQSAAQDPMVWLYSAKPGGAGRVWPPPDLVGAASQSAIKTGVTRFDEAWRARAQDGTPRLQAIERLRIAVADFISVQEAMQQSVNGGAITSDDYAKLCRAFDAHARKLEEATARIDQARSDLEKLRADEPEQTSISALASEEEVKLNRDCKAAYDRLANAARPLTWLKIPDPPSRNSQGTPSGDLAAVDSYLSPINGYDSKQQPRYQVYARIYSDTQTYLNANAPSLPATSQPSESGSLPDELASAKELVAGAAGPVVESIRASSSPSDVSRGRLLAETFDKASHIAASSLRARLISKFLDTVPTVDQLEQSVSAASSGGAGVSLPSVPYTALNADTSYQKKYDPAGAQAVLSSWAAPAPWLEPSSSASAQVQVLNRLELAQRYDLAETASDEYVRRYIKYWSSEIPGMLAVHLDPKEKWETFASRSGLDAAKVNAAITDLLKSVDSALTRIDPFAARQRAELTAASGRIRADLRELAPKEFTDSARALIKAWSERDPIAARTSILKTEPSQFISTYTIPDARGAAAQYWNGLSQARLTLLASTWNAMCKQVFDEKIREPYGRFPLNSSAERPALTDAEFRQAGPVIAEYLKAARPSSEPHTIGGASALPDLPGKNALEQLRSYYKPEEDPAWFEEAQAIIDALSAPDAKCTVYVLNRARRQQLLEGATPVDGFWSDVHLRLPDGKEQVVRASAEDADVKLADCPLRGEIRFDFNRMPTTPVDPKVARPFAGPWGVLQMLNTLPRVSRTSGDPRRWEVELVIPDGGRGHSLWLALVFDKPLPDRAHWPHLRNR